MKKRDHWYLPDSDGLEPLGPFSFDQIEQNLINGDLRIYDFIWNGEFASERWIRILELRDFEHLWSSYPKCRFPKRVSRGSSNIRKLEVKYAEDLKNLAHENEFRRYPRAPIRANALVHNQSHYSQGTIHDISERGVYLVIPDIDRFKIGEEVTVSILNHEHLETLSIKSVIINSRIKDGHQGHGIYFLHLNPQHRRKIVEYVVNTLNDNEDEEGDDIQEIEVA